MGGSHGTGIMTKLFVSPTGFNEARYNASLEALSGP